MLDAAVDREISRCVTERRWHASQKVRRRIGGGCELEFRVDGLQEVKRFILGLGAAVVVFEAAGFERRWRAAPEGPLPKSGLGSCHLRALSRAAPLKPRKLKSLSP
ncbi:MAG: WYL domain-containing protein [Candidatus Binatia bacterium]